MSAVKAFMEWERTSEFAAHRRALRRAARGKSITTPILVGYTPEEEAAIRKGKGKGSIAHTKAWRRWRRYAHKTGQSGWLARSMWKKIQIPLSQIRTGEMLLVSAAGQ